MATLRRTARRQTGAGERHGAAWRLLAPFFVFVLAALVAAGHRLLGEPLGPTATAKLADLWQTMAAVSLAYAPIYGQYRRQTAVESVNVGPRRRLSTGSSPALQRHADDTTGQDDDAP